MKLFSSKLKPNDIVVILADKPTAWDMPTMGLVIDRVIDGNFGKDEYVVSPKGGKIAERRFLLKVNIEPPKNLWERFIRFLKGEV